MGVRLRLVKAPEAHIVHFRTANLNQQDAAWKAGVNPGKAILLATNPDGTLPVVPFGKGRYNLTLPKNQADHGVLKRCRFYMHFAIGLETARWVERSTTPRGCFR